MRYLIINTLFIYRYEWSIFFLFTLLHLFANYLAVSSLIFRTLNALRFNIILRSYCRFDDVPFPEAVNRLEPVVFCLKNKHSGIYTIFNSFQISQDNRNASYASFCFYILLYISTVKISIFFFFIYCQIFNKVEDIQRCF